MINPYAAGNKVYGGGRPHPTQGPVDPMGYAERDAGPAKRPVELNAAARKLRALKDKNYASSDMKRAVPTVQSRAAASLLGFKG